MNVTKISQKMKNESIKENIKEREESILKKEKKCFVIITVTYKVLLRLYI